MNFSIFKNIFWLLAERVVQVLSAFIISGLISRQLGVTEYGDFQYALSIILIFSAAGLICGAEVLLPKIVSADQKILNGLIVSGFFLRLVASIVAYLLILLYGYIFIDSKQMRFLLYILGLTVIFREPFAVVSVFFQSQTFSKPVAITSIALLFFKIFALTSIYHINKVSLAVLSGIWVLEVLISSLIYGILYIKEVKKREILLYCRCIDFEKIFKEGCVYWLPLILMTIFLRVDRLLVKALTPAYDAGLYLAAMQLFDAVVSVALIISASLAPTLIYKYSDIDKIKANTIRLILLMFGIGFISTGVGYCISPYLVLKVFGSDFADAIPIAKTAFCISFLVFVDSAFNVYLIKCLGAKYALIKWTLTVAIAIPVEYFLICSWGAQAAHVGIAVGYCIAILFGFYQLGIKVSYE